MENIAEILFDVFNDWQSGIVSRSAAMNCFVRYYEKEIERERTLGNLPDNLRIMSNTEQARIETRVEDELQGYEFTEDGIPIITDDMWKNL